jgi:hypothetical protein
MSQPILTQLTYDPRYKDEDNLTKKKQKKSQNSRSNKSNHVNH